MAGFPPDMFYLIQRNEMLAAENQRQAGSIRTLVDQERQFQQIVGDYRRQLAEKEAEKRGVQEEVERLRAQLQETQQQVQELEGRREEPRRKKARGRPGEFVPSVRLNNTAAPWSTLSPSSLREKKAALRNGYLEPCFSRLPQNVVKAKVNFRTEDGFCIEVDWPQGPNDRRGRAPPAEHVPVTGRGYRHQTDETKDLVRWCVYFKDQASVSDVWWHELHMKFPKVIPPIGWIKEERGEQNSFIPYRLEENARDGNGASRSVKEIVTRHLLMPENKHLIEAEEPVVSFRYGLDGRPQAKNTTIGAVMACITPVRDVQEAQKHPRSVRDEYCVFLYSGKEDYEEQVQAGSRVFREMEDLQQNGFELTVVEESGQERTKHVNINWYIVSDWKALAEMMGLVGPTGNYFCVLCYCSKDHLSRFSQAFPLRTQEKASQYIRDKDNRGHQKVPVMSIPWENVIIDTLHMYLRIGGKLLTQLIGWVIDQDVPEKLVQAMKDVGIRTFFLKKEATKQGPSTYKWKTLSAKELKKAIKLLPDKLPNIIKNIGCAPERKIDSLSGPQLTSILNSKEVPKVPQRISERKALLKRLLGNVETVSLPGREQDDNAEIRVEQIQELWREFSRLMNIPRDPEQHGNYKTAARKWAENFRDTTYIEDCTPYIHYFGCHAGDQLHTHPFLHFVNCETIEKKNHVQTRRYHLATQKGGGHNPSKWAEQLMQMENRETFAAVHGIGKRQKRKWTRRSQPEDPGYGGGSASESESEGSAGVRDTDTDDEEDADDRIVYDGDQDD